MQKGLFRYAAAGLALGMLVVGCASTTPGRRILAGGSLELGEHEGLAAIGVASDQPVSRLVITHRLSSHQVDLGPIDAGTSRHLLALPSGTWCTELVMLGQAELHVTSPPCFDMADGTTVYVGTYRLDPAGFGLQPADEVEKARFAQAYPALAPTGPQPASGGEDPEQTEVFDPDE